MKSHISVEQITPYLVSTQSITRPTHISLIPHPRIPIEFA